MPTWFETERGIFEEERKFLEGLGFVLDQAKFDTDRRVIFIGPARADPARKLTITFPSGYPSSAPQIADDGASPLLARHHTAESRAFCLFGHGARWWSSQLSVSDALDEVDALIRKYPPGVAVVLKEEPPEPISDLLPLSRAGGILIPPEICARFEATANSLEFGQCQIFLNHEKDLFRGVVLNATWCDTKTEAAPQYRNYLPSKNSLLKNTAVIRLDHTPPLYTSKAGPVDWIKYIPDRLRSRDRPRNEWFIFIYPEEAKAATNTALGYTALHLDNTTWTTYRCFPLTERHSFARIPGLESLAKKHVVIFGLGALGSRIAHSLAASGVRTFTLVDPDSYEPVNAVRHSCGVRAFGVPKVIAVGAQLVDVNPWCAGKVTPVFARAGDLHPNDEDQLLALIKSADLIVDATASEQAAHWLDHVSFREHKACIHAKVTNGAWGGDVFRVIPGATPCWACHEVAHEPPATKPRDNNEFPPGCAQPTFTGNTAEVSIVAELAAAMAIETLLGNPGRDFQGSHIRWFARSPDGLWLPRIEVVTPTARPNCFCTSWPKRSGTSS